MMYRRYKILSGVGRDDGNIWRTFTDLLSIILLFVLLFFTYTNVIKQMQVNEIHNGFITMDDKIKRILGVKQEIIQKLKNSFQNLNVDENTGDIIFSSDILFEFNKDTLSPQFYETLDSFLPKYISILMGPEYKANISEIIIEGHTDDVGTYAYNLDLSQRRAKTIANYILDNSARFQINRDELEHVITANGKSKSSLIKDASGKIDPEKSRRVVFKFRLKEDEMIKEISKILKEKIE